MATIQKTKQAVRPRRSLAGARKLTKAQAGKKLDKEFENFADLQTQADVLKGKLDKAEESIKNLMKQSNVKHHDHAGWDADEVDVKTRSSTSYSAHRLYERLEQNDQLESFWDAVKVQATAVKEVLSGRELAEISTVTPGEVTGTAIKIKPTKKTVVKK